jgi:hypothetical protein
MGVEDTVALIHYEKLLESPGESLEQLSRQIRHRIPPRNALILTEPETDAKKNPLEIHPEIRAACEALEIRLAAAAATWRERLSRS